MVRRKTERSRNKYTKKGYTKKVSRNKYTKKRSRNKYTKKRSRNKYTKRELALQKGGDGGVAVAVVAALAAIALGRSGYRRWKRTGGIMASGE